MEIALNKEEIKEITPYFNSYCAINELNPNICWNPILAKTVFLSKKYLDDFITEKINKINEDFGKFNWTINLFKNNIVYISKQ